VTVRFAVPIASLALLVTLAVPAAPMAQGPQGGQHTEQLVNADGGVAAGKATSKPASASSSLVDTPSTATASRASSVSIQDGSSQSSFRFAPSSLTISSGTKVTWTNNGQQPHNVTGDGLKSSTLSNGNTYSFTFNDPGTYNYECTIHPFMTGSVKVTDRSSGGNSSGNSSSGTGSSSSGTARSGTTSTVPSTTTGTGSESAAGSSAGAAGSSSSLPSTGFDAVLMGELGIALLLAGFVLRRRSA
jgi:LPXTG-motif cell wall-anchored protein